MSTEGTPLAMPELDQLHVALSGRFPEPWVQHHLASFPPAYFATFSTDDVARQLGLMMALTDARPIAVRAEPIGDQEWRVEVVGLDAFQLLSTICCLLAIHRLLVVEGHVFTSQPPSPPQPSRTPARRGPRPSRPPRPSVSRGPDRRRRIVDVFRVRATCPGAPNWTDFERPLACLARLLHAGQYDEVHRHLIGRFVAALAAERPAPGPAALERIDVAIAAAPEREATVVRVAARDSPGFLYLTASALALCGIRIMHAEIRTGAGWADDVFWVTDRWGRPIPAGAERRQLRLSMVLIEHFSSRLPSATNPESALLHFSRFVTETMARPDWAEEFAALDRPEVLDALARVLGESDFLWEDYLHARPEAILPLVGNPAEWQRRRSPAELAADLDAALAAAPLPDDRRRAIRRFKDREIFRAGVRAILERSGGPEGLSAELSDVAEVLLRASYRAAVEELASDLPRRADGQPAPSALMALGKCGGRELGFGSDLELMLVFDDRDLAESPHGRGPGEAFDRLVARLRDLLEAREQETFALDLRLRPYGRSGPLATSRSAFAGYFRAGGPAWGYERQALVKLRAVAGEPAFGRDVEALRDRFVYGPEPFDVDGYRRMRRLQVDQLVRPGTINAKFSAGALVDAEYLVQAMQIAHGAADPTLRTPSTLGALVALEASGRLGPGDAAELRESYRFFRALIDALRVVHGHSKDLAVPRVGSDEFGRLARRMGLDPDELPDRIDRRLGATLAIADRLEELIRPAAT